MIVILNIALSSSAQTCLTAKDTHLWAPAHATTFVLSVYEIEYVILQALADLVSGETDVQARDELNKQITNWNTVLKNYRNHNEDQTAMFNSDVKALQDLSDQIQDVTTSTMFSFSQLDTDCSNVSPIFRNEDMKTMCSLLKQRNIKKIAESVLEACNDKNLLASAKYIEQLCKTGNNQVSNSIGGFKGSNSIFDFFRDNTKYLTFGANTQFVMIYESVISKSFEQQISLSSSEALSGNIGTSFDDLIGVISVNGFLTSTTEGIESSSSDKSRSISRSISRAVSITLADEDHGDLEIIHIYILYMITFYTV